MDYHKFKQVLIPIATAISDIVFLLGQNDMALAFGMQLLTWVMVFSPYQFSGTTKKSMFSLCRANSISLPLASGLHQFCSLP